MSDECHCKIEVMQAKIEAVEKMLHERDLRYSERFAAQEKAERLFLSSLESWKAHTNEWRGAMEDRERRFLSKSMGAVIGAATIALLLVQLITSLGGAK